MTGFFKGIQKSRQTLLGRRAFEALIEEFRQQDSVSLEKLGVHSVLCKQAQWAALSAARR
ncbi:hypothetical protein CSC32_5115 [Pseudomonas aeruginosa]|nr:hypothetical protein CSC32_5115 [Pseudomonas aeruginosa]RCG90332.1 hypothetical protein CSB86_6561 [Pseudomonas aeruginosa]GAA16202.1 hypothetical protein NCGM1179_1018 [Pseudomonas aeruginosa NCMG1179]